jgi:hypothetical protein
MITRHSKLLCKSNDCGIKNHKKWLLYYNCSIFNGGRKEGRTPEVLSLTSPRAAGLLVFSFFFFWPQRLPHAPHATYPQPPHDQD